MTYKTILLLVIRIGLFVVPFVPLYIASGLFFPYITGKAFAFRIIVEVIFALWIGLALFDPQYRLRRTPILLSVLAFLAVVSLATIFAVNPARSFWSNYERMEGLIAYLHFGAYFLVLAHVFTKRHWKIFFNCFIVAGFFEALYVFAQKFGLPFVSSPAGAGVVDGTVGNLTYVAAYLTFALVFSLLTAYRATESYMRYSYLFVAFCSVVAIILPASRGPALSLVFGAIGFGIVYTILIRRSRLVIGMIVVALVIPATLWSLRNTSFIQSSAMLGKLTNYSTVGVSGSINARFNIWKMAWAGVKEHPVLGWGPEGFVVVFAKYYLPEMWPQEPWFDRSHNFIFDWLIRAGFLGLFAYFAMFASAFYMLWNFYRKKLLEPEIILLFATLIFMYLFQNLFVFDQIATYIGIFAVLAYLHSVAIASRVSDVGNAAVHTRASFLIHSDYVILVFGLLLLPLVVVVYFVNVKPLLANLTLIEALQVQATPNVQLAFPIYQRALAYQTFGSQEIREQFTRFVDSAVQSNIAEDVKLHIVRSALSELQIGIAENKSDPRVYLFLSNILLRIGALDDTEKVLQQALTLSPKKQQILFALADIYLRKGNTVAAVAVAKRAFDYAPQFGTARINLAGLYILNNQQQEADALLLEEYHTVDVPEELLARVYTMRNDTRRLLGIRRAFVESNPTNGDYALQLARMYVALGNVSKAIGVLESAASHNSAFAGQASTTIVEIRAGRFQ